ncbi:hypothetical protein BH23ACT8_BH23ACT8_24870 [soil metagenome]
MTPRLRRLQSDYERLTMGLAGHPRITLQPIGPTPPERYRFVYRVRGMHQQADGGLRFADQHAVEIALVGGYPREKPYCTSLSPVFHPNFGNYVCIADFWSPGQTLLDVVIQIGDMLQYKLYNTSSPLNAVAARWAVENIAMLPLDRAELLPLDPEVRLGAVRTPPAAALLPPLPATADLSFGARHV